MADTNFSFDGYIALTEFLGRALGPDYEVALHDLSDYDHSLIAIANNHISGREIGSPITNMAMEIVAEDKHAFSDYKINYKSENKFGKNLRSSTYFIKDREGVLRGLLCINFDDSKYVSLSETILKMCHPNAFVDSNFSFSYPTEGISFASKNTNGTKIFIDEFDPERVETFYQTSHETLENTINEVVSSINVPVYRMTTEEKQEAVRLMDKRGVFLLKGSVKTVANALDSSVATIYRYLNDLKK